MRRRKTVLAGLLLAVLASAAAASDWFTRVEKLGVRDAAAEDVALFEKGQLPPSLHVGDCYYHLERYREGADVFRSLRRRPDRNYAAAATVREAEGLVKLGRAGEARALFESCLEEYPEAFLDVDIPELCHAWLAEIESVEPEAPPAPDDEEDAAGGSVQSEVLRLEKEIEDLRRRIAELRKLLGEAGREGK